MSLGSPLRMFAVVGAVVGGSALAAANGRTPVESIEIRGVVRSIAGTGGQTELSLSTIDGMTKVRLPEAVSGVQLIDAVVSVRGYWIPIRSDSGIEIRRDFQAAPASLTVTAPATAHDGLPVQRVADMLSVFAPTPLSRRVRVRGTVTLLSTRTLYIADGSDGLQVEFNERPAAQVGDQVDVAGFPELRSQRPRLVSATVYRLGLAAEPQPLAVTAAQLMTGRHHGILVRVEGDLAALKNADGRNTLVMEDDAVAFETRLPWSLPDGAPKVGSRFAVVGVASIRFDERGRARGFIIFPRQPADITVISSGAWWQSSRVVIGLSVSCGAAMLALGWVLLLNRKIPETERALERSVSRHREMFEGSPAGTFITRHDGTVVTCNSACARMLGYESTTAMTAVNARDMYVDPADRDEYLLQLRRDGRVESRETELKRADGTTLYVLLTAVAHFDGTGALAEADGYLIDVSGQKNAEAALLSNETQVRLAQRMEAMGRLAGGVSHDFNNLLTAILGHAALLLEDRHPDSPDRPHLVQIQKAATSAASLTRQLLAFSRKQVIQPATLDLNAVVSEVSAMLVRILGEHIALVTELADGPAYVLADHGQLEQVLINLAVNARDAMPNGGRLAVVVATTKRNEVHLTVRDTGGGIAAHDLPHIFEPFYSTKDPGSGTGLGLSTVYGIVSQSGGSIDVQSTEGLGTTFVIRLPRFCAPSEPAAHTAIAAASVNRGNETILVVEDEVAVRTLLQVTLERRGYSVVLAEDGQIAVSTIARSPSAIDLVLSDVVMPKMNGVELTSTLRALHPNLKVLLMSGYAGYPGCQMPKLPKDVTLLQKPFTPETLVAGVRAALDGVSSASALADR